MLYNIKHKIKSVIRQFREGDANMSTQTSRVTLAGEMLPAYNEILTPEALSFLKELHENFNGRRTRTFKKRVEKQKRIDAGEFPKFLEETKNIREGDWTIAQFRKI